MVTRCTGRIVTVLCLAAFVGGGCGGKAVLQSQEEELSRLEQEKEKLRNEWVSRRLAERDEERHAAYAKEDEAYERQQEAERQRKEAILKNAEEMNLQIEDYRRAAERKERDLRTLALQESPQIWKTIQNLRGTTEEQDARIAEMQRTAMENGMPYRWREEYERIYRARNKLMRTLRMVEDRLSEALMAQKRYQASAHKSELAEATRKALEDGILESELVWKQYEEMSREAF